MELLLLYVRCFVFLGGGVGGPDTCGAAEKGGRERRDQGVVCSRCVLILFTEGAAAVRS